MPPETCVQNTIRNHSAIQLIVMMTSWQNGGATRFFSGISLASAMQLRICSSRTREFMDK